MPGGITGIHTADLDSLDASLGVRFRWNERARESKVFGENRVECLLKPVPGRLLQKGLCYDKIRASWSAPLIRWLA